MEQKFPIESKILFEKMNEVLASQKGIRIAEKNDMLMFIKGEKSPQIGFFGGKPGFNFHISVSEIDSKKSMLIFEGTSGSRFTALQGLTALSKGTTAAAMERQTHERMCEESQKEFFLSLISEMSKRL